jgi:hypothetical protein
VALKGGYQAELVEAFEHILRQVQDDNALQTEIVFPVRQGDIPIAHFFKNRTKLCRSIYWISVLFLI